MKKKDIINPFEPTPVFLANIQAIDGTVINQGGTWSGKTYSILQVLYFLTALYQTEDKSPTITTIVGQDVPNLTKGAIRDFENIQDKLLNSDLPDVVKDQFRTVYNSTKKTHTFKNGAKLEFSSFKNWQDAKSGKRHFCFINEANGIPFKIYEQLAFRTIVRMFLDFNPDAPFWAHHKLQGKESVKWIYSNFTHNKFCPSDVRRHIIEKGKANHVWWRVYGLGKTGQTEGVVFDNVRWVSELPKDEDCKKICYGMDWGYTNDPSTLVKVCLFQGELYIQGLLYETGLKYKDIASKLVSLGIDGGRNEIFADHDQRGIDTIQDYGVYINPAKKGAGSIETGIQTIKEYRLNIVTDENFKAEQLAYKWKEDKMTGKATTTPIDKFNHYWDALRYAMQGITEESNPYLSY